ncbi:MAG TPA: peptidase T [Bacteroidales bacterium]|nr:peptidase T [Bacteroidales bacterium]
MMKEIILERFLRYVRTDTQSMSDSSRFPSSDKQLQFAKKLTGELKDTGLSDISMDENGYVMASLPSNVDHAVPVIGFLAHMDTSPDMSGTNVNPQVVNNYDGGDILLNRDSGLTMKTSDFPEIKQYKGQTIITTDGTTLLGADDKAGIAEIITAMEYLISHPEIKHGTVKVGFTPDEEVGRGVDFFDVKKFGADYAYTMDGGEIGELEYENFNAAKAKVVIQGRNVHPGTAKNKMINSLLIAGEFNNMLPSGERPEFTTDYEGFFHLTRIEGNVENSVIEYIIRDHDSAKIEQKKELMHDIARLLNRKYPDGTVRLEMQDQYFNMREKIEPVFHILEIARRAMENLGIQPKIVPVRGGTDGSRLSFMGLPCPNIFAGGHNFHGKFEYIPLESMEAATRVIIRIAAMYAGLPK